MYVFAVKLLRVDAFSRSYFNAGAIGVRPEMLQRSSLRSSRCRCRQHGLQPAHPAARAAPGHELLSLFRCVLVTPARFIFLIVLWMEEILHHLHSKHFQ